MNRFSLKHLILLAVIIIMVGCSKSEPELVNNSVGNYGEFGAIVFQIAENKFKNPLHRHPGIPGVRDDHIPGSFVNMPRGQQEVVWQLAEVGECDKVISSESFDKRFSGTYIAQRRCKEWKPLPKIYRQTLDFDALLETEAYKEATKPHFQLDTTKHGIRILFAFQDEQVTMHVSYFKTNPWN